MAKKEPKAVVEDIVGRLAMKQALVEYTRKEVPLPGQTGGGSTMVEFVHSDIKNPFELAFVASPTEQMQARVRFPLTRELTEEQIDQAAPDILKLAAGIEGNLSVNQNRVVLSFSMSQKDAGNLEMAGQVLNAVIRRGTSYSQGLRGVLDKSFGFATDPGAEKWYQYKLGQPVKLTAGEMNQLQGGGLWDGLGTVVAGGLGCMFGVAGGVVVGAIAYTEEVAITHPEQFVPVYNAITAPAANCAPMCGVCSP